MFGDLDARGWRATLNHHEQAAAPQASGRYAGVSRELVPNEFTSKPLMK